MAEPALDQAESGASLQSGGAAPVTVRAGASYSRFVTAMRIFLPLVALAIVVLVVHLAVVPLGVWPGLALALATSLTWNAGLIVAKSRLERA